MPNNKNHFVKEGDMLTFASKLKEKGLWPPRLHRSDELNNDSDNPTATPYLLIPSTVADIGSRPLPNSKIFYSRSVWLEDINGNLVTVPAIGGNYKIKCRIVNNGAFASYGGMANFYIAPPANVNIAAAGGTGLPVFGITGFSVLPGQDVTITCPLSWHPLTANDLMISIIVHAYDPLADNITIRFDARYDRHVGRHDYTSDFYVRDWTTSPSLHDNGEEPSTEVVFYSTSDVWNRRSNTPGTFISDQPENENPQAGNGSAGENFVFARVSRSNTSTQETVYAHFLFAEFGTGSPFTDCSQAPDPSIIFQVGQAQKIISMPWQLHPSSSTHLCIAVQIYSDGDTYLPPGLLGYTPGWPQTDLMVINDNNKGQRNMHVWDGVPEQPAAHIILINNSATFIRNFELQADTDKHAANRLKNARIRIFSSNLSETFKPGKSIFLKNMQPGEKRWISFEYDRFSAKAGEILKVSFNEIAGKKAVNGFTIGIKAVSLNQGILSAYHAQQSLLYRMVKGIGINSAGEALLFTDGLLKEKNDSKTYVQACQKSANYLLTAVNEISEKFGGLKDIFSIRESLALLTRGREKTGIVKLVALHLKILSQLDAWQTIALKSKGDEADILFTVRLQKDLYNHKKLLATTKFQKLEMESVDFISKYSTGKITSETYADFVNRSVSFFTITAEYFGGNILAESLKNIVTSLNVNEAAGIQKAHLGFLNNLSVIISR